MSKTPHPLIESLRLLLISRKAETQEALCALLKKQGYEVHQSKISRLLRKIGATKVVNDQGQVVYSLPREPSPFPVDTPIKSLILEMTANETLVVILTAPGAASMIARVLDYNQSTTEILGTIAGDDTIFVVPKSIKNISKLFKEIQTLLS